MFKFNAVERSLRNEDYQACFAYVKPGLQLTWIWSTSSAVMISTPDGLFKVIIACCIDHYLAFCSLTPMS